MAWPAGTMRGAAIQPRFDALASAASSRIPPVCTNSPRLRTVVNPARSVRSALVTARRVRNAGSSCTGMSGLRVVAAAEDEVDLHVHQAGQERVVTEVDHHGVVGDLRGCTATMRSSWTSTSPGVTYSPDHDVEQTGGPHEDGRLGRAGPGHDALGGGAGPAHGIPAGPLLRKPASHRMRTPYSIGPIGPPRPERPVTKPVDSPIGRPVDYDAIDFFRGNEVVDDPYPYFDHLRGRCPVTREPHHDVMMVTGYDEAVQVYNDTAVFSSCNAVTGPFPGFPVPLVGDDVSDLIEAHRDELPMADQLPNMDPPMHTAHRGLLMRLITPKRLKENEEFMWRLADRQIDEFHASG